MLLDFHSNSRRTKMVIDDINAKGGLLGRQIDLYLEDSATADSVAEVKARKLVQQDQVDVIFGGIYSSTRQAIKGPVVEEGRKLYIYPEQYEGEECHRLIFCTGPVPAQQVESMIPWLMQKTGAKKFYCPSADYIWPHTMNRKLREVVSANGGTIVGEEYFPLQHTNYGAIPDTGADASALPWTDCAQLTLDPRHGVPGLIGGVGTTAAPTILFAVWAHLDRQTYPCRLQADFTGPNASSGAMC